MLLPDIVELLTKGREAHARGETWSQAYRKAIAALEQRFAALPASAEIRELLVRAHIGYGVVLADADDARAEPIAQFSAAIALAPEISADDERRGLVELVATAHAHRASTVAATDPEAALADFTRAIALAGQATTGQQHVLGLSYSGRARLRFHADPEGSRADATAAVAAFEALRALGADDRGGRASALHRRAKANGAIADHDAAVGVFDGDAALAPTERLVLVRVLLGRAGARLLAGDVPGAHADHERAFASAHGFGPFDDRNRAGELARISTRFHRGATHAALGALAAAEQDFEDARHAFAAVTGARAAKLSVAIVMADISLTTALHLRSEAMVKSSLYDFERVMSSARHASGSAALDALPPVVRVNIARLADRYLALPLTDTARARVVSCRDSLGDEVL